MVKHEQRAVHRVAFPAHAILRPDKDSVEVELLNISLKGALVKWPDSQEKPTTSSPMLMHLVLGDGVRLELSGKVVHSDDSSRIGLMWEEMDVDTATHLHRLLVLNLGEEALFEMDLEAMLAAQIQE